jgi:Holliday junction resolvase
MRESQLRARIKRWLLAAGAQPYVTHGSVYSVRGTPDILACYRGRFIAIEVKVGRNKPTHSQLLQLDAIRKAGGYAMVVWTMDDFVDGMAGIDRDIDMEGQ